MRFIHFAMRSRSVVYVVAPLLVLYAGWGGLPRAISGNLRNMGEAKLSRPESFVPPDEWEPAVKEFQALTDSTLECGREEMPAYWRLLKWSVQVPQSRPAEFPRLSYGELVNSPSKCRGQALRVELCACRVLSYEAPRNSLGIKRLYEIWGWNEDSRGSLYVVVSPELPPGIAPGETVSERLRVEGYFCKIQGYVAVGSAAQSAPSAAPLIIGRLAKYQPPATPLVTGRELWHGTAALLLIATFIGTLSRKPLFPKRNSDLLSGRRAQSEDLETWLDQEESLATSSS
jgi:hypothetical protein